LPKMQNFSTETSKESALFALMALLGSGLASLWIDEHATKRTPSESDFLSMPVPPGINWPILESIGRQLFYAGTDNTVLLQNVTPHLERVIWQMYGLAESTVELFSGRLSLKEPPEGGNRYHAAASLPRPVGVLEPGREPRIGAVLDVEKDGVRIWVNTVTSSDGLKMPVPLRFPGALVYPDATFETDAHEEDELAYAQFWPQREAWRGDDELDEYLNA
jgi:hypothetical protein